ncbi:hypothetical protein C7W88_17045 [Novosphingobium sp. THN1]|uniref:hypothetical protein n=1 Tax=Novosphingobium sp. THN1 TaxID=1016987 RepID=UPI000E4F1D5C|nr:hypothetical protein [Novosphingobium sp. THN1]AXU20385.1 hypothetical protein C7W88_17045 [Novosphingobium sp. THN1]
MTGFEKALTAKPEFSGVSGHMVGETGANAANGLGVAEAADLRDKIARTIASALGDNFSDAFKNKQRWIAKRGMSGGRFRDINEPFQHDYLDAADAVIALLTPTPQEARHD